VGDGIAASAREEATKVTPGMGNEGEEWRSVREGETVSERAAVQAERATCVTDKGCRRARAVAAEFGAQGDDYGRNNCRGYWAIQRRCILDCGCLLRTRGPFIAPDASEYGGTLGI
jgi:hypothetical protein